MKVSQFARPITLLVLLAWVSGAQADPATPKSSEVMSFTTSGFALGTALVPPKTVTFYLGGVRAFDVHANGTVKMYLPPNDAARVFWEAVKTVSPNFCSSARMEFK